MNQPRSTVHGVLLKDNLGPVPPPARAGVDGPGPVAATACAHVRFPSSQSVDAYMRASTSPQHGRRKYMPLMGSSGHMETCAVELLDVEEHLGFSS